MIQSRAKRLVVNGTVGVLYIALAVFALGRLRPVMARRASSMAALRGAQETLGVWLHKTFPSQARIDTESNFKGGLQAEVGRLRAYCQSRNAMLKRSLLEAYSGDPVRVKLKYQELRRQWEAKSRYEYARSVLGKAFAPAYAWEEAGKMPGRDEFKLLEKKACVMDVVVGIVADGPCAIGRIAVGEPSEGAAAAGAAEPPPRALPGGRAAPYVAWPVSVELICSFRQLGAVLDKAATPPADYPCVLTRTVNVQALPSPKSPLEASQVVVRLSMDVLEFR